jgi:DNA modification methylase
MEINKIYPENCLDTLARMPDEFVDCVVTSPPYWGLRDYGHNGQIGLEETPEEYVNKLVEIFREVRRVLKKEGTVWLNLGDSYGTGSSGQNFSNEHGSTANSTKPPGGYGHVKRPAVKNMHKQLIGIPWKVAFALQSDGCADFKALQVLSDIINELKDEYQEQIPNRILKVLDRLEKEYTKAKGESWWLRQDIIWSKPNPMPESVKDRCTKAHEYIFLLTKSAKYFYDADAIKEDATWIEKTPRESGASRNGKKYREKVKYGGGGTSFQGHSGNYKSNGELINPDNKRNKRSVWGIATQPFPEAHFATFPEKLPSLCILAGCPKDGIVYDPFIGAGTTALAALKYGRQFIGSEISEEYCEIAEKRLEPHLKQLNLF